MSECIRRHRLLRGQSVELTAKLTSSDAHLCTAERASSTCGCQGYSSLTWAVHAAATLAKLSQLSAGSCVAWQWPLHLLTCLRKGIAAPAVHSRAL